MSECGLEQRNPSVTLVLLPMWDTSMPPLSLACLSWYLRRHSVSVTVLDANIDLFQGVSAEQRTLWDMAKLGFWIDGREKFPGVVLRALENLLDPLVERILASPGAWLGFSVTKSNALFTREVLLRLLPLKGTRKVVLGGHHCGHPAYRALFDDLPLDHIVVGEGEQALLDLIRGQRSERLLLAGEDLDPEALGLPDFAGFDLDRYTSRTLPVWFGRGCVYRCAFCEDSTLAGRYRGRDPAGLAADLERLVSATGRTDLLFVDLLLNAHSERLAELCRAILDRGLVLHWHGLLVIDRRDGQDFYDLLAAAGCHTVAFGVEHGSERVLRRMRKRFHAEDVPVVLGRARKAGLHTAINLIVGFPGESEEDFEELLDFLRRHHGGISSIGSLNTYTLLVGTQVERKMAEWGIEAPEGWQPSTQFWWDGDTIFEERDRRMQRLSVLLEELGLAYYSSTVDVVDRQFRAHPEDHERGEDYLRVRAVDFFQGNLNRWDRTFGGLVLDNGVYPNVVRYKVRPLRQGTYEWWLGMAADEPRTLECWVGDCLLLTMTPRSTGGMFDTNVAWFRCGTFELPLTGAILTLRARGMVPHLHGLYLRKVSPAHGPQDPPAVGERPGLNPRSER
ncbi:MAG: hypothetical protein A2284_08935 [Deltaproteobacteria bacterium RIFOXYA12_FULL_61_11]|nr:MAG: hypothetical protein A2284_08935 [Deltaproteobacteria bacterium RIFOXYA12_FULL_61_11]